MKLEASGAAHEPLANAMTTMATALSCKSRFGTHNGLLVRRNKQHLISPTRQQSCHPLYAIINVDPENTQVGFWSPSDQNTGAAAIWTISLIYCRHQRTRPSLRKGGKAGVGPKWGASFNLRT